MSRIDQAARLVCRAELTVYACTRLVGVSGLAVSTGWINFNLSIALALITRHYSLISPEPPVGNQLIPVAA